MQLLDPRRSEYNFGEHTGNNFKDWMDWKYGWRKPILLPQSQQAELASEHAWSQGRAGSSSCKDYTCAGLSYQHRGTPRGIVSSLFLVLLEQKELEGSVCLDWLWLSPFQMKQEAEGWASPASVCLFGRSNSASRKKELSLNSEKQIHACKFSTDNIL